MFFGSAIPEISSAANMNNLLKRFQDEGPLPWPPQPMQQFAPQFPNFYAQPPLPEFLWIALAATALNHAGSDQAQATPVLAPSGPPRPPAAVETPQLWGGNTEAAAA